MSTKESAIAMTKLNAELERQRLLAECHNLITLIGQKHYSLRLLRAARDGLLLYANYKESRRRRQQEQGENT